VPGQPAPGCDSTEGSVTAGLRNGDFGFKEEERVNDERFGIKLIRYAK
jgi:hypothetical protein